MAPERFESVCVCLCRAHTHRDPNTPGHCDKHANQCALMRGLSCTTFRVLLMPAPGCAVSKAGACAPPPYR